MRARLPPLRLLGALLLLAGAAPAPRALAQEAAQEVQTRAFDFEDSAIEGELQQPEGELLTTISGLPPASEIPPDLDARLAGAARLPRPAQIRLALLLAVRRMQHRIRGYELEERARLAREAAERARLMQSSQAEEARAAADAEAAIGLLRVALAPPSAEPPEEQARHLRVLLFLEVEGRQARAASTTAQRLIAACPSCREAADALLMLAERAFAEAALEVAEGFYRRVVAHPAAPSELVAYAQYKLAWCAVNLARFGDAFVAFAAARAASAGPRGRMLRREAARDQLRALAMLGHGPDEQLRILRGLSPDAGTEAEVIERYLGMLRDQGREAEADALRARLPSR